MVDIYINHSNIFYIIKKNIVPFIGPKWAHIRVCFMVPNIDHIRVLNTGPFMVLIIDPIIGPKWATHIIKINMDHKWVPFIGPNQAHIMDHNFNIIVCAGL